MCDGNNGTFMPDVDNPLSFFMVLIVLYGIIALRYVLVAGLFYVIFHRWQREKWLERKLAKKEYPPKQLKREVCRSLLSAACFAFTATIILLLWQKEYTRIYSEVSSYSLWWLPLSLVISLFIDETYYYWIHRWMHHPTVFKKIHKIHHESNITSPWTAAAFHPLEAFLLSLPLLFTVLVLPMHTGVILMQLLIMTFSSVINHLNIEIYSRRHTSGALAQWLIGPRHHSLHHKQFKYNFGLYFTFWDRIKKTESPLMKNAATEDSQPLV